jgi:stage II sporulation protein D
VRITGKKGFSSDSVAVSGVTGDDTFMLANGSRERATRLYTGDLGCKADMGSLMVINTTDIEKYIAGVVKAEGGNGRSSEYFKTQAVIARTYTYRNIDKHSHDHYNLCDDVHCQSYTGIISEKNILDAVFQTRDIVITTIDSILIISAFHSNCGGETASSEYVWLSPQPYLVKVTDPHCAGNRNSVWSKKIDLGEWVGTLRKGGYSGPDGKSVDYTFYQPSRAENYKKGSFSMPFRNIRNEMNLRSSWFSVIATGDSIRLSGRGYGHGVGLCQEGAMSMAQKGSAYTDIIRFYYPGVRLMNNSVAKKPPVVE